MFANAINQGWVYLKENDGEKADKKPALNPDLWSQLSELLEKHQVTFKWVRDITNTPKTKMWDQPFPNAKNTNK